MKKTLLILNLIILILILSLISSNEDDKIVINGFYKDEAINVYIKNNQIYVKDKKINKNEESSINNLSNIYNVKYDDYLYISDKNKEELIKKVTLNDKILYLNKNKYKNIIVGTSDSIDKVKNIDNLDDFNKYLWDKYMMFFEENNKLIRLNGEEMPVKLTQEDDESYNINISSWRKYYDTEIISINYLNVILDTLIFITKEEDIAFKLWHYIDYLSINGENNLNLFEIDFEKLENTKIIKFKDIIISIETINKEMRINVKR